MILTVTLNPCLHKFVRFRAPVYQLLQPYGNVTVSLPGGDQRWQFVRLEN